MKCSNELYKCYGVRNYCNSSEVRYKWEIKKGKAIPVTGRGGP
jgi:hypothetical protein